MNSPTKFDEFKTYVGECLWILYATYFKPNTFFCWLQDIHPDLYIDSNPFKLKKELQNHPRLRRYGNQLLWLSSLTPVTFVLIFGLSYSLFTAESFNWLNSGIFLISWSVGIVIAKGGNENFSDWAAVMIYAVFIINVLLGIGSHIAPESVETIREQVFSTMLYRLAFGVALGLAFGVVDGVAFGVALGIAFGVAFGVVEAVIVGVTEGLAFGIAFSVVFSVARGVARSVVLGIVFGVAEGVTISDTEGLALGVAFSIAFCAACILGVLRIYFWLPELLWMLVISLLSQDKKEDQFLTYLPPYFDELIILPLPFMVKMIIAAYKKNTAAARKTIAYLINSTNQQKVAAKAITGIAINTLRQTETPGDITHIAEELYWLPSPPPKALGSILPKFLEISQDVRSCQDSTSAYRQSELLNPPMRKLEALNNNLAYSKDAQLATNFGTIAQRWLGILKTAQNTLTERAKKSTEIPQVYIAGSALDPETAKKRFKGRQDIFREIENFSLMDQPPVLLLNGGRRTGKTSSLKYLPDKVGSDIVPLLVDMQGSAVATTLKGIAAYLAEAIIKAAQKSRNLELPYPDWEKRPHEPFLSLQDWFTTIERQVPGKRFLLCLDEYERLGEVVSSTGSRAPLNFLRHNLQHNRRWILLFSGVHIVSELEPYWSDYLINTRSLRLSYLKEEEARELVTAPIPDFPSIYEPAAVDTIIQETGCQPYLVQLLCSVVVDHLNSQKRQLATPEDVQTFLPKAIEIGDPYFNELWTKLPENDQNLLLALVTGEKLDPFPRVSLQRLMRKDILHKTSQGYSFQVPLIERYIENLAQSL